MRPWIRNPWGFTVHDLETVLARPPEANVGPTVPGLTFRLADPDDPAHVEAYVTTMRLGFFADGGATEATDAIHRRVVSHPRTRIWLLELGGEVVGTGGLELFEGAGVLITGCVLPGSRRRGIHQAFMGFRLSVAAQLGCHIALVGSVPGGPTERNALRLGFQPAYTELGLRLRSPVRGTAGPR